DSNDIHHPFRDLYLGGLLGVIVDVPERGTMIQRFRRPRDPLLHAVQLPESPVYLMHPALETFIRLQRTIAPFLQFQHMHVGEDLVWEPYYQTLMRFEQQLRECAEQTFVELAHQLVKRIQSVLNSGKSSFGRLEIENSIDWRAVWEYEGRDD